MAQSEEPQEERYLGLTPTQLNVTFLAVVGVVAIAAALYFNALGAVQDAIGGGNEDGASVASPTETPTAEAPAETPVAPGETPVPEDDGDGDAQAAAEAAVMTLDDMPTGWFVQAADAEDASDFDFGEDDVSAECAEASERSENDGSIAETASPTFEGPEGQEVDQEVYAYASVEEAEASMDLGDEAFQACLDDIKKAFEAGVAAAAAEDDVAYDIQSDFQKISYASIGEETLAFRLSITMTVEGLTFPFTWDIIAFRQGSMVSTVSYLAVGFLNDLEEEALARKAASKMSDALALLR